MREAREYYGKLSVHGQTEMTELEIPTLEEFVTMSDLDSDNDTERLLLELETTDESAFGDADEIGEDEALSGLETVEAEYESQELESTDEVHPEEQEADEVE